MGLVFLVVLQTAYEASKCCFDFELEDGVFDMQEITDVYSV